jgi:hypothetical protein
MFHIENLLNCTVHDILTLSSTNVDASSNQLQFRMHDAPKPLRLKPAFKRYFCLGKDLYNKIVFTDANTWPDNTFTHM